MLTKAHQKLLVMMLAKDITRKDNSIFKSKAFYRAITYLEKNGLVKRFQRENESSRTEGHRQVVIKLTFAGLVMAKMLAGLTDVPEETRLAHGWR